MSNNTVLIEYDESDFTVTSKEKDYGDQVGKFRIIRYSTGYYALQRWNVNDFNQEDPSPFAWETMCIAPQLDTPLETGYDWKFSQGRLTMRSLLRHLENSSKLQNNELMELHIKLNDSLDDEVSSQIVKIITTETGKSIEDRIFESIRLQEDKFFEETMKNARWEKFFIAVMIGIILCNLIVLIINLTNLW